MLSLLAACASPVTVDRIDQQTDYRTFTRNTMSSNELSEDSRNIFRQLSVLASFDRAPAATLAVLHQRVASGTAEPQELFALAEASYLFGRRGGGRPYLLASALYAQAFLFPKDHTRAPDAFDPRFRQACDLYNLALSEALMGEDGVHVVLRGGRYDLPFGTIDISLDDASLEWGQGRLTDFLPSTRMGVRGLNNIYRHAGLGAPLAVATPAPLTDVAGGDDPRVLPGGQGDTAALRPGQVARGIIRGRFRIPGTVLLDVDAPAEQIRKKHLQGRLSLHLIFDEQSAEVHGRTVPLEYRQSAALAQGLQEANLWRQEFRAFLFGDLLNGLPARLAALTEHRQGRIPVVLIHGTASSEARWADMVNDLMADQRISQHYEFWFFSYATGNPIPYSAMQLREALNASIQRLGGPGADPALGQMVLIGHSQGGLLAKMMAVDPGDRLWAQISRRRPEDLQLSPASLDLIRRSYFFRPVPEVRRVIFIATPHGGSFLTEFAVTRLLSRLITLPLSVAEASAEVLSGNADAVALNLHGARLGSLNGMTPGSPFIASMRPLPLAPGVTGNSIIAVQGNGPPESGSDGVVRFESAHLPGMESEFIVRSGHSTQNNPQTIAEVRRLLLLHWRNVCPVIHRGTATAC
ncbi:alpha/beta hydrolase (plasmid) [Roseomonas gilardii subsp. gilardii]|uniref:esterase/lipase family protein n=1 Tax=Roseomonas gilardii TaxID=257708 RepID=UPI001FFA11E6|nr:alpha/beta hydrolase [Roseomonas gilardii]UPG74748.1 alpha/beta hydrolase [Roseomonas gilardii subsp. gilardii]